MTSKHSPETEVLRQSEERFRLLVEGVKDYAIFLLDPDGYIISWNTGAERIKGYKANEIIGKHFSIFYPQHRIDSGWPAHELEVARKVGRFEDEEWRLRKDGSRFWANVIITAMESADGTFLGFSKVTRDMTERKAQEEALRQSEERFRLLVEGVKDYAIFMLDPDGYISSWNTGAERIKGYKATEIIGKHFSVFYPQERIDQRWPEYELEVARKEGRFEDEGWRLRKDGSRFWANVVITALVDHDGRMRGFTKVTRDMTERKRIEALELAERQMNEFLAMLSHELRNPLAPIRNAVYLMQISTLEDPELVWARDVIDRQVTQLTRLIDDLLEVGRITSGNIKLKKEEVDIRMIVERAVEASRPLIDSRKHRLEVSVPERALLVSGDATRLIQVLVNLLNNAAKYTIESGEITVTVREQKPYVMISVRDTGIGIAPEFLRKAFDLFTQGERTLDRSEGGLGIGLTLVRRLAEMHGGNVEAYSRGLGEGSEFIVTLPLLNAAEKRDETGGSQERSRRVDGTGIRVLVVDDNVDAAMSMMRFLTSWRYDVRVAHDGVAAIHSAKVFRPHIVLLDLGLPKMNGFEVAERLRDEVAMKNVKLIAVTGYGQHDDRQRTAEAGFTHHLVKPIDPLMLESLLAAMHTTSSESQE